MNVLMVLAHPRRNSLTAQAAEAFASAASARMSRQRPGRWAMAYLLLWR